MAGEAGGASATLSVGNAAPDPDTARVLEEEEVPRGLLPAPLAAVKVALPSVAVEEEDGRRKVRRGRREKRRRRRRRRGTGACGGGGLLIALALLLLLRLRKAAMRAAAEGDGAVPVSLALVPFLPVCRPHNHRRGMTVRVPDSAAGRQRGEGERAKHVNHLSCTKRVREGGDLLSHEKELELPGLLGGEGLDEVGDILEKGLFVGLNEVAVGEPPDPFLQEADNPLIDPPAQRRPSVTLCRLGGGGVMGGGVPAAHVLACILLEVLFVDDAEHIHEGLPELLGGAVGAEGKEEGSTEVAHVLEDAAT